MYKIKENKLKKEAWKKPKVSNLDIKKTESNYNATGPENTEFAGSPLNNPSS